MHFLPPLKFGVAAQLALANEMWAEWVSPLWAHMHPTTFVPAGCSASWEGTSITLGPRETMVNNAPLGMNEKCFYCLSHGNLGDDYYSTAHPILTSSPQGSKEYMWVASIGRDFQEEEKACTKALGYQEIVVMWRTKWSRDSKEGSNRKRGWQAVSQRVF